VNALDPDILNLQEVNPSAQATVNLLNRIAPLAEGTWYAQKGASNIIASKYPLSMLASSIDPTSDRPPAIALVDLPDEQFGSDLYIINSHFEAGSTPELRAQKQRNADATIQWIRDARTPGGLVDLPPGTPIIVVGDLNNIPGSSIVNTLVTGDIVNEDLYGSDYPPDWDGSSFTQARPTINGLGADDYTFRVNDFTRKISHIIYSDSALDEANKFVLNTLEMSPAELAATGLQPFDVTIDSVGEVFDHLPLVTDFRIFDFADSDFNFDRVVDDSDVALWESSYGLGGGADADGDGDTDGADFLTWQREFQGSASLLATSSATIPEPSTALLLGLVLFGKLIVMRDHH